MELYILLFFTYTFLQTQMAYHDLFFSKRILSVPIHVNPWLNKIFGFSRRQHRASLYPFCLVMRVKNEST